MGCWDEGKEIWMGERGGERGKQVGGREGGRGKRVMGGSGGSGEGTRERVQ